MPVKPPNRVVFLDFAEIEARLLADMSQALGVPSDQMGKEAHDARQRGKIARHVLNSKVGTITGRFTRESPPFQELVPDKTKD
jgi:hypothetical protein